MYKETGEKWWNENGLCPVCGSSCYENTDFGPEGIITRPTAVVCPICGKFRFANSARFSFSSAKEKQLSYRLSFHLRSISERAFGKRDNSYFPLYDNEGLKRILETRDPQIVEKLQLLLKYLAGLSEHPGQEVLFDSAHDYSVLCCKNPEEADFHLHALSEQGLVSMQLLLTGDTPCALTSSGWQELERVGQSGAESSNAFIAMWFDPSQSAVSESIQSAVAASGYTSVRIDEVEHVNRIDDEIIARIRQSKFLVADLTGQRNGVYFEAGFMLGLGRPVIWLCRESDLENVHFDTRQYNMVVYDDVEQLKSKLQFRIEAIIGKGPHVA